MPYGANSNVFTAGYPPAFKTNIVDMSSCSSCLRLLVPQLRSLHLLLLLLQHQLVEPGMIGFLLSLFGMDHCKKMLKEEPKYKTPGGLSVSSKGLFQALLADVIAESFVINMDACNSEEAMKPGTKANTACANLRASAKLTKTLRQVIPLIANDDWEAARSKAKTFAGDFHAAAEDYELMQAMQASAKVYATMSVCLCRSCCFSTVCFSSLFKSGSEERPCY